MEVKSFVKELEKKKHKEKREYIKGVLMQYGISFKTQQFVTIFGSGENIVVDYAFASDPKNESHIVLSAHYDTAFDFPGANDDASGVAVLLSLLIQFHTLKKRTHPIRFIFFDREERFPFLLGSKSYVKKYGVSNVEKMISLDAVGEGDSLLIWADQNNSPGVIKLVSDSAKKYKTKTFIVSPVIALLPFHIGFSSDHLPFLAKGCVNSCCITMISEEDKNFGERVLQKKQVGHFLKSLSLYYLKKKNDLPLFLRHYHNKNDRVAFIEEAALKKVYAILVDLIQK
jgi:hypothetical protein